MSQDARLLAALVAKLRCEVTYFELVTLQFADRFGKPETEAAADAVVHTGLAGLTERRHEAAERKIYLCVGHHALFLVRCNFAKVLKRGGELRYEWIQQFVVDSSSRTNFKVVLGKSNHRPPDGPAQVLVICEHRASMLKKIAICYLADSMHRLNKVVSFPQSEEDMKWRHDPHGVLPWQGYKRAVYHGYSIFIREEFVDKPSAASTVNSGVYKGPCRILNPSASVQMEHEELDLALHVYDPVPLTHLGRIGREHIRWLATEYKQAMVRGQQTYVLRNQVYLKKMNLSNDMAAWIGWELLLRTQNYTTAVVLLRRQYVPPLMDTVQDFAVVLKCPSNVIFEKWVTDEDLLHETHMMADTLGVQAQNTILYPDLIQAKLDALLYDEEGYAWIRSRLRLRPDGANRLEKCSSIFVKGVLKILRDEGVLSHPEIWEEICHRVMPLCEDRSEQDVDPLTIVQKNLYGPAEGLVWRSTEEDEDTLVALTAWQGRVAQFLAYCVDGGLMGAKFTLADIVTCLTNDQVSEVAAKKLEDILAFLLHLRSTDPRRKFEFSPLRNQLLSIGFLDSRGAGPGTRGGTPATFNSRVMQVMLEMGFFEKLLLRDTGSGSDNTELSHFLCNLLQCDSSSVNLRAAICRHIIAGQGAEQGTGLCAGLLHIMRTGGLFLATYACAAFVNLSQANSMVKQFLMSSSAPELCLQQLQSQDDDLVLYTLMLLVHLTKSEQHRSALMQLGLLPVLYETLSSSYAAVQYKRRMVTELCSVLGQMCNNDIARQELLSISRKGGRPGAAGVSTLDMLRVVYSTASAGLQEQGKREAGQPLSAPIAKILSKVIFAFKQLCANSMDLKEKVGNFLASDVVADLALPENLEHKDWAVNAIMLVLLLSVNRPVQIILQPTWSGTFNVLSGSHLGQLDATRDRILQIEQNLSEYERSISQAYGQPST